MVDYNLINSLGNMDADVDAAVATALGDAANDITKLVAADEAQDFTPGAIIKGKVSSVIGDDFVVELGLKSEGVLERSEFDEPDNVKIGDEVKVLLEEIEGLFLLAFFRQQAFAIEAVLQLRDVAAG